MAATAGKNKVRLDYSAMIDEAIADTASPAFKDSAPEDNIKETPAEKKDSPAKTEPEPLKTAPSKPKKEKAAETPKIRDPFDAKFAQKQKGRGVQKSVYLEEDVHNYIQSKCEKYNIKYSQVLNEILREAIKGYK